ncbi:unnamed protein product [Prunus armeniaca]
MDQMVAMQLCWEQRLARFNPSVEINFDKSGEPPSPSPSMDATPEPEPATTDALPPSLEGVAFFMYCNLLSFDINCASKMIIM